MSDALIFFFAYGYLGHNTKGYQKVRRLVRWNQYLLINYDYKLSREYNTTNALSVVKI